jgi:hypothetical protein
MQSRRCVIHANIVIRAVLGRRVRELIAQVAMNIAYYIAEANATKDR